MLQSILFCLSSLEAAGDSNNAGAAGTGGVYSPPPKKNSGTCWIARRRATKEGKRDQVGNEDCVGGDDATGNRGKQSLIAREDQRRGRQKGREGESGAFKSSTTLITPKFRISVGWGRLVNTLNTIQR